MGVKSYPSFFVLMRDKVSEQRIELLHPKFREIAKGFIEECEETLNITLRIVQGLRTIEEQNDLYAQGRTKPGPIVTKAKGGSSFHNYGVAIDVVELVDGKANWNFDYRKLRIIYPKYTLQWGADWDGDGKTKAEGDKDGEPIVDAPHYQKKFGYTWQQLYKKYVNKEFIPGTKYVNI